MSSLLTNDQAAALDGAFIDVLGPAGQRLSGVFSLSAIINSVIAGGGGGPPMADILETLGGVSGSNAVTLAASGSDATIDIVLSPKGSGLLRAVPGAALGITSQVADGATAVAFTLNNTNALGTAGAKLLSLQNAGTEEVAIDKGGKIFTNSIGAISASSLSLYGAPTSNGSAIGTSLGSSTVLSMAGDKLLQVKNSATEKASVDYNGLGTFLGGLTVAANKALTFSSCSITESASGGGTLTVSTGGGGLALSASPLTLSNGQTIYFNTSQTDGLLFSGGIHTLTSSVANGAASSGVLNLNTTATLNTAGDLLLSAKNNGASKFSVDYAGNTTLAANATLTFSTSSINESGGNTLHLVGGAGGTTLGGGGGSGGVTPSIDNNFNFGSGSARWATMYTFGLQTYQSGTDKVAVTIQPGAVLDLNGTAPGLTATAGLVYAGGSINTYPSSVLFQAAGVFALNANSIGFSVPASSAIGFQGQGSSKAGLYLGQNAGGALEVFGAPFQDSGRILASTSSNAASNYNALTSDHSILMTSDSARTVTLPGASLAGTEYVIIDASGSVTAGHTLTVQASSGTVKSGGTATAVITPGVSGSITAVSDGTNYWITAKI